MPTSRKKTRTQRVDERESIPVEQQVEIPTPPESFEVIEELLETFTLQELLTVRALVERKRQHKLEEAKATIIEEAERRLRELGLHDLEGYPRNLGCPKSVVL